VLEAGTSIGGYVLVKTIGSGATAVVYEAKRDGHVLALKVLRPECAADPTIRAAFLGESGRAAGFRHPHAVEVIETGEADGFAYAASALVAGPDLRTVLVEAGGRIGPERTCALGRQIAEALDEAHRRGLVHRDVKPANILVASHGSGDQGYVCDFGVATDVAAGAPGEGDELVGTVGYVAPEQIRGDVVTAAADQYALACVLLTCLAGRPPFVRDSELGVVYAHLEEPPPRVSSLCQELPAQVDQVFARALAKDPAERFESCLEFVQALELAARGKRWRRGRRTGVLAAAAAILLVAVGGALARTLAGPAGEQLRPGDVGVLDPKDGSVARIATGGFVSDLAPYPGGRFLALQPFARQVLILDPQQRTVERTFSLGIDPGGAPAFAAGRIWVSDPAERALLRIHPAYNALDRFPLPKSGLSDPSEAGNSMYAFGSLWTPDGRSFLERIDPATGTVRARIGVAGAQYVVAGEGQLWVLSPDLGSAFRIDPAANRIVARADIHPPLNAGAVARGYLWVAIGPDGQIWKIARDGRVLGAVTTGADPESLVAARDAVWVANSGSATLTRIDAITNTPRTYPVGIDPYSVAVAGSKILFGAESPTPGATAPLPPSGRNVIRLALTQDWIANADPAVYDASSPASPALDQLFFATCAKLYNNPDAGGRAGARLVPEVAAALPQVSDGGRLWRIGVRRGFRFSPPSGESVDARTFAGVLVRDLTPEMQSPRAMAVFGDIVGARAFHEGKTARLAGVTASRDTLTIRLERPSADLAARLASPLACAVPRRTPAANSPNGLGTIPMAGPYYLAQYSPGESAVVRRNPNYAGRRPRHLDAIVYEIGVAGAAAVTQVAEGKSDLHEQFSPFPYTSELMPGATGFPGTRVYRPLRAGSRFVAVDGRRGPLRERGLRRAVALALDRRTLARLWASPEAAQLIPLQSKPAPVRDLAAARRLVGDRHPRLTLVSCRIPAPTCRQTADAVRDQLALIGMTVRVRLEDDPVASAARERADLLLDVSAHEWSDEGAALAPLLSLPAGFRPSGLPAKLARASRLRGAARLAALSTAAQSLERDGLIHVYARTAYAELASTRLGCVVHSPVSSLIDLAALCTRPS
jgi:serine/threonine-protein kinase